MKKFANGIYEVRITGITYGESSIKKTPFFNCRLEGSGRYHEEPVYLTEKSKKYIKNLYYIAGVSTNKFDGSDLVGSELGIEIVTGTSVKATGEYVTFPKLDKLYTLKEMKEMEIARCESYKEANKYTEDSYGSYNEYEDSRCDYSASIAEVFDANINDIARDMGKEPCEITDDDILEYNGY